MHCEVRLEQYCMLALSQAAAFSFYHGFSSSDGGSVQWPSRPSLMKYPKYAVANNYTVGTHNLTCSLTDFNCKTLHKPNSDALITLPYFQQY